MKMASTDTIQLTITSANSILWLFSWSSLNNLKWSIALTRASLNRSLYFPTRLCRYVSFLISSTSLPLKSPGVSDGTVLSVLQLSVTPVKYISCLTSCLRYVLELILVQNSIGTMKVFSLTWMVFSMISCFHSINR